jgi:hypothetical protein
MVTTTQRLILTLAHVNAGDYLDWVRDPEPPALDREVLSIDLRADPLGDTIEAVLVWRGSPPSPLEAAPLAGLPLTEDVVDVESPELALAA